MFPLKRFSADCVVQPTREAPSKLSAKLKPPVSRMKIDPAIDYYQLHLNRIISRYLQRETRIITAQDILKYRESSRRFKSLPHRGCS